MIKKFSLLSFGAACLFFFGAGCLDLGGGAPQGPLGMFRSADKGESWTQINAWPTAQGVKSLSGAKVYKVFTDPSDSDALYVATRRQGLYYSYNRGDSWQETEVFRGRFIYGLAIDPRDKCVIYVADEQHIFKTTDCQRSWKLVYTEERPGQHMVSLAIDYASSATVYAAALGGDILVSGDGGASWRVTKRFGFDLQHLAADPFKAGRVYVASQGNGLFRSDDYGVTFTDFSAGLKNYNDSLTFYRLVQHPTSPDIIFWVSKYGVLRSNDAGASWTDIKLITPPGGVNIYAFALNPGNEKEMYYTGTILGEKNAPIRSTLYKSNDGGHSWVTKKLPSAAVPVSIIVHPKQNMLFLGFTLLN